MCRCFFTTLFIIDFNSREVYAIEARKCSMLKDLRTKIPHYQLVLNELLPLKKIIREARLVTKQMKRGKKKGYQGDKNVRIGRV